MDREIQNGDIDVFTFKDNNSEDLKKVMETNVSPAITSKKTKKRKCSQETSELSAESENNEPEDDVLFKCKVVKRLQIRNRILKNIWRPTKK